LSLGLAILAGVLLAKGSAPDALVCAREAFGVMEGFGQTEEGESRVRIAAPAWRRRFLEDVPENARTLELAGAWLGDAG
jgi:hypothetical protein